MSLLDIFAWDDREQVRSLSRYLQTHDGLSADKARKEARRIVELVRAARSYERDWKTTKHAVDRILETPSEAGRRTAVDALLGRLDTIIKNHPRSLTKNQRRWASDIRKNAQTVHAPTEDRVITLTLQVDRFAEHLAERVASSGR